MDARPVGSRRSPRLQLSGSALETGTAKTHASSLLVVESDIEKGTVNLYPVLAILNEA
jgi:hypothetical protein